MTMSENMAAISVSGHLLEKITIFHFNLLERERKLFAVAAPKLLPELALLSVPHKDQFCKGPIFLMPPPHQMENATQLFAGLNC